MDLVILSINILCYVDVAYGYTLPATVLPLKLFLTSTYEMKLIYDRTHLNKGHRTDKKHTVITH